MLEIKSFYGEWRPCTRKQAEEFYNHFCNGSQAIKTEDKQKYFNTNHIRGGKIE